ncbi:hypothetical protein B5F39_07600 [Cloacibacillus sp. An23]|nr:hypothetical protein B5F39_07600 [Cloacibacillus sp. An23]
MTRADGREGRIILRTERTFLRKMSGGGCEAPPLYCATNPRCRRCVAPRSRAARHERDRQMDDIRYRGSDMPHILYTAERPRNFK